MAEDGQEPPAAGGDQRSATAEATDRRRLHPLWRVAVVFAVAILFGVSIDGAGDALFGEGYSRAGHVMRAIATLALYVPLVVVARRYLDRRPLSGVGLQPLRRAWRPLLVGMAAWLLPAAIGTALVVGLGWSQITLRGSFGALVAVVALRVVMVLIYEALPEELLFRGYLYSNLAMVAPRWLAVVGQAVLFTLWGMAAAGATSADRVVLFLVFALVLGVIRVRTGTVWTTIGFHLVFQTVTQAMSPAETVFAISDLLTLQAIAFALLPFVLAPLIVMWAQPVPPDWRGREPERRPTQPQSA